LVDGDGEDIDGGGGAVSVVELGVVDVVAMVAVKRCL
jgi:hypothetical protein